jgi:hypothetical protein
MPTIAPGVDFDTVAREWRCKWSADNEKQSLQELQKALLDVVPKVSAVAGIKNVQRIVCGGCLDFKVVTSLPAEKFGDWEKNSFEPEAEFLEAIKKIAGVSAVETQTYTKMPVKRPPPPPKLKKAKTWDIGRLKPDAKGFTLMAKVLEDPKEVETKGSAKISEVAVGDASGKVTLSLKGDEAVIKKDAVLMFRNARIIMVKNHIRLVVDKWGKIEPADADDKIETVGDKDISETEFELVKG